MDVRHSSGKPSRVELIAIQPAKAWIVYTLMVVLAATLALGTVGYLQLLDRTRAVCQPLRQGQQLGVHATTEVGRQFAATFGHSADKLGCPQAKESHG